MSENYDLDRVSAPPHQQLIEPTGNLLKATVGAIDFNLSLRHVTNKMFVLFQPVCETSSIVLSFNLTPVPLYMYL